MTKEEFLKKLRKKLDILEDKEIEDILSEYETNIEEKVNSGLSEEEAVKELGDFNEIVNDLLAAYKLKNKDEEEGGLSKFLNKFNRGIDNFIDTLNNKSGKDILKIIIEIAIILLLILLLKIPFSLLCDLGTDLFAPLSMPIANAFNNIWCFIINLSYIILSVVVFIKMLEKRYFENISETIITKENNNKIDEKSTKDKQVKDKPSTEKKSNGFISTLSSICIIFLKFITIFIIFGIICYLIGTSVALGIMIYLIACGVKYFGVLLLIIAMFLGGVFLLQIGINFIFNRHFKALTCFIELIVIIILTGLGLTFSTIELTNTEIIYENKYKDIKTLTKEIDAKDNLYLYYYDELIVDNTLEDKIRIEYTYPDIDNLNGVEIDLENCGYNSYCLSENINSYKINKKLFNTLIDNLKDKKIYVYDYKIKKTVYVNEKNYKLLKEHPNKSNPETEIFTKTYKLKSIKNNNNNFYYDLTLLDEYEAEYDVKILKSLLQNPELNSTYTFTFEGETGSSHEDVEEIFDECKLLEITKENKEATP